MNMKMKLRVLAEKIWGCDPRTSKRTQWRRWKTLTFLSACIVLVAVFAQRELPQEWYALKDESGKETLFPAQRNWEAKLICQNPAGIDPKQRPIGKWTPISNIFWSGAMTHMKPSNIYKVIKIGDADWKPEYGESYQIEKGEAGTFWRDWEKMPKTSTTLGVAIVETAQGDYLPAPLELFVEQGGEKLPAGKVTLNQKYGRTFLNPIVPRTNSPQEKEFDLQGSTPERFAKLQAILSWRDKRGAETPRHLVASKDNPNNTKGVFETLEEQQASGWDPEKNVWSFSLRPQFDKWNLAIKGSNREAASRPEISCGVHAFQAALELLWSEKEGQTVKLSASFLRWAHDQIAKKSLGVGTSTVFMAEAVRTYGVCEETLMGFHERTPSAKAIANASNRKQLVTRQVGIHYNLNNNLNIPGIRAVPIVEMIRAELDKGRPVLAYGRQLAPTQWSNPILSVSESRFLKEYRKTGVWPKGADGALTYPQNGRGEDHITLITGYFAAMSGDAGTSPILEERQLPYYPKNQGYTYFLELRQAFGAGGGDKGHYYMPSSHYGYPARSDFISLGLD